MRKFLKIDWIVMLCSILLIGMGLFTLYSLTLTNLEGRQAFFQKEFISQLIFTLTGVIISIIIFNIPAAYFRFKIVLGFIFVFTSSLLIATLLFGINVNGAKRWIAIGGSDGITIQASEFTKITVIVITSALLSYASKESLTSKSFVSKIKELLFNKKYLFIALLLNFILISLIYAQSSLSVITIIVTVIASILFANSQNKTQSILIVVSFIITFLMSQNILFKFSGLTKSVFFVTSLCIYTFSVYSKSINYRFIFTSIALGIISGAFILNFAWNHLISDYQKARVEAALSQNRDAQKEGFQQEQSKQSTGGGKVFGHGFRQISDSRLLNQPEPTTDFIFSIFAFKFGFIGSFIMIAVYLGLILRLFYLADEMNDRFSSLILIGTATMILAQFFSSIGINLDILPVGGTTLPLISAGGSSLLTIMISLAICQNVISSSKTDRNIHHRRDRVVINGWNA
jgi:rod shape determining protein RodA